MNVQSLRDQSRQRTRTDGPFNPALFTAPTVQPAKPLERSDAGLQAPHASSLRVAQASPKSKPTTQPQPTPKGGAKRSR